MLNIALIGAGSRGTQYCRHAVAHGAGIAAVCDTDAQRRDMAGEAFGVRAERRFDSVEALLASGTPFDAAINATMDQQHVATTLPLLKAGKNVLLEKPICLSKAELFALYGQARESGSKVMVCHTLRYTPFYTAIKRRVLAGELGRIKHIYASESVGQSHMAAAFIRGKWGNSVRCGSKILMAKCCHDMDLLAWFKSGVRPVKVVSMGNLFEYRSEQARPGAGEICTADCPLEAECPYSARLNYVRNEQWGVYAWRDILEKGGDLQGKTIPEQDKLEYLASGARFGRCVYRLDNDQYDTQSVIVRFEDGTHAEFGLNGGTPKSDR
ncbi:MAG TPA: Gfo/Idh/MocA family oxidoreductase, partial [Clostridia bacterium]|nr:Gfo/Idh/MocA family oxidoreductase [Clostridia bacterium]